MKYAGIAFMLFVLFSCEHPVEPTQPTVTSVTISPSEVELTVGDTLQFNAVVEGTGEFDSTLAWYVNKVLGGNATYGTITQSGFYTTPDTVPFEPQVTVQVISIADTSKWGSAIVTILEPEPRITSVTVSPSEVQLSISTTTQFTAEVTGTGDFNPDVSWRVNNIVGGITKYGTITSEGLYTAPETVPVEMQAIVQAVSVADSMKHGSAIVEIFFVESVTVSPEYAMASVAQSVQFTASVTGAGNFDPEVFWYVNDVESGTSIHGTITTEGVYRAPETVPTDGANDARVTIKAKSAADILVSDSAIVDVYIIDSIAVVPQLDSLYVHQEQRFLVLFYGAGNPPTTTTWLVNDMEGGSERYGYIDQNGLYTVPPTVPFGKYDPWDAEVVTVSAVSMENPSKCDDASFFITSGITRLGINPVLPRAAPGDTIQFTAIFYGNPVDSTVKWYVGDALGGGYYEGGNNEYGIISETGLYIAPSEVPQGTDVWVTVQSVADLRKNASADIVSF